jgi:hypothetical protein
VDRTTEDLKRKNEMSNAVTKAAPDTFFCFGEGEGKKLRALMFDDDASSLEPTEYVMAQIGFKPVIKGTLAQLEDVIGDTRATLVPPVDEQEEEWPFGLLVVDEHHPGIKHFGTNAGEIDTDNGELAGFKIWEHLIQAENSRLRDVPTIIISEHEIPQRVRSKVEKCRREEKKPIWFHAKPSERTKAAFAEFVLKEVVPNMPELLPLQGEKQISEPECPENEASEERLALRGVFKLIDRWRIDDRTAGLLLGLHHDGLEEKVACLRSGSARLPSRDSLDRIDILFEMGALVHAILGGDVKAQANWLRTPLKSAANRSIIKVLEGDGTWKFENLLEARHVVRMIAGQAV